jgi:NAD(P)H-flavin reductase
LSSSLAHLSAKTDTKYFYLSTSCWQSLPLSDFTSRVFSRLSIANHKRKERRAKWHDSHVSIFTTHEYFPYIWPLVAIWSFDRSIRILRLIYCNLHVNFNYRKLKCTKTAASYDPESDIIKLSVTLAGTKPQPRAGDYYFIYQPFRWSGYEGHPFTLANWQPASSSSLNSSDDSGTQLDFFIRPADGWTRYLRDQCIESNTPSNTWTMLLEGPYGKTRKLWDTYDTVLLIAGGLGITAMIPYLREYIRRSSVTTQSANTTVRTRRITLAWADRHRAFFHKIIDDDLADVAQCAYIEIRLYCTLAESIGSSSSSSFMDTSVPPKFVDLEQSSKDRQPEGQHVRVIHHRRPDVRTIVKTESNRAHEGAEAMAILVCGPAEMADSARAATVQAMRSGVRGIEYLEDVFSW